MDAILFGEGIWQEVKKNFRPTGYCLAFPCERLELELIAAKLLQSPDFHSLL